MDRLWSPLTRAEVTESGGLSGYAAVFNQPTSRQRDYPGTETIAREAFDGVLGDDVLALVDHDYSKVLGRSTSGTLRLATDDYGLRCEIDLPDTQLGRDVRVLVARGDLNGMSFGFRPGVVERTSGGVVHRSFAGLGDVSIVSRPAYDGTTVSARNAAGRSLQAQLASIRAKLFMGGNL